MTFLFPANIFFLNSVRLQDYSPLKARWFSASMSRWAGRRAASSCLVPGALVVFFLFTCGASEWLQGSQSPGTSFPELYKRFPGAAPALSPSASWWDKGRELGRECSSRWAADHWSPVAAMPLPPQESQELTAWSPSPTVLRSHAWRQNQLTKLMKICSILNYFSKVKRSFQEASVVLTHTESSCVSFHVVKIRERVRGISVDF